MIISIFIEGLVPKTTLNSREHWAAKHRRAKKERSTVYLKLRAKGSPPALPATVVMWRAAPRLLDSDNAVSAMKSVRDGVADWLGIDDRDDRVTWRVEQRKSTDFPGTSIHIEAPDRELPA